MKTFLLIVFSSLYLALSVASMTGELAVLESRCLHCRLATVGVKTATASPSTRKVMRYHGVTAMKTVGRDTYIHLKGKWLRIRDRGGT